MAKKKAAKTSRKATSIVKKTTAASSAKKSARVGKKKPAQKQPRQKARPAPGVTVAPTKESAEFREDHLRAAAEFVHRVGSIDRARGLLDYLHATWDQNPWYREGLS